MKAVSGDVQQKGGLRWAEDWGGVGKGASVTVTAKAEKSARLQSDVPRTCEHACFM